MRVLTVNAGSSSVRFALAQLVNGAWRPLARHHESDPDAARSASALDPLLAEGQAAPDAVVHRIVFGGSQFHQVTRIDAAVETRLQQMTALAPLHMPANLRWVQVIRDRFGADVSQFAAFDTAFFTHLPLPAATYAIDRQLAQRHDLRRHGFHGLAHANMLRRWCASHAGATPGRLITFQLGSGCSVAAIKDGKPVETSMGFTPVEGLVMSSRSGDLDPGLLLHLMRAEGLDIDGADRLLNKASGLRGLSGLSGNMKTLLDSDAPDARLAVDVFCHRARKYLGAYIAVLGGVDGVVFGGGIGEHAPEVRARILAGLQGLGLQLSDRENRATVGRDGPIHAGGSAAEIWVATVDEASEMLEQLRATW